MTAFKIEDIAASDGSLFTADVNGLVDCESWQPEVTIEGQFTPAQLRAIADWIDGHGEKAKPL